MALVSKQYPDFAAGQEVRIRWRDEDFRFACCDCNLVHLLRFRVEGDEVVMQVWRHARATGQLRRRRGVPIREREERDVS